MKNEEGQGESMNVENKDVRPQPNPVYADVFHRLGIIEGRLEEVDKKVNLTVQNQAQIEKDLLGKVDFISTNLTKINEQMLVNAALDKAYKEMTQQQTVERREYDRARLEEKKEVVSQFPKTLAITIQIMTIIAALWGVFTLIGK
jgi:hypothetical protein